MLEHFFGSKTRLKLLQVFFRNPGKQFYVRELSRMINTQLNAVRREVANLFKLNIIEPVPKDQIQDKDFGKEKSKFYRVKIDSLLYVELEALLSKVQVIEEQELIDEVREKAGDLKLFLLSGVFTGDKDADIDMLLVGKIKPVTMNRLVKRFEDVLRQPLRYTIMNEDEYKERKEIGDKFLYNAFESNHLIVLDKISKNL